MRVRLKDLKPNPLRDFTVDPVEQDRVDALAESIEEDGFWGGVVCRRGKNGDIEVGGGQHRVLGAIKAGVKEADLYVGNFTDADMVRVYARENALQRGNTSTALAGSVAAAVRFLAKGLMTDDPETSKIFEVSRNGLAKVKTALASDEGLGEIAVLAILPKDAPGINLGSVRQQLAHLKNSRNYARIIAEVEAEIEEEHREAMKELERQEKEQRRLQREREEAERREAEAREARKEAARRAREAKEEADRKRAREAEQQAKLNEEKARIERELAEKRRKEMEEELKKLGGTKATVDKARKVAATADKRQRTFDYEGVSKVLKNPHQLDVFRKCVEGSGDEPLVPVEEQAALAASLAEQAGSKKELTGVFIREKIDELLRGAERNERKEEGLPDIDDFVEEMKGTINDFLKHGKLREQMTELLRFKDHISPSQRATLVRVLRGLIERCQAAVNELESVPGGPARPGRQRQQIGVKDAGAETNGATANR